MVRFYSPRVAIVCDWLTSFGGAERVILALSEIFPQAPIYTTIYNPELTQFRNKKVVTTFLQKMPFSKTKYPYYLPLMPKAIESFDFSKYDLVISSCHSVAKGIITKPDTLHFCYIHTPMRYVWQKDIDERAKGILKGIILKRIQKWDYLAAQRPNFIIANSKNIQERIKKFYQRESEVIYPPVDTQKFKPNFKTPGEYFLVVSRLIPYKKIDLAVEAFNLLKLPLKIVGIGPELQKLKKKAGKNIEFLGKVSDNKLIKVYQNAKAFIFPAEEDFGIVPLEAQSCGKPVIAFEGGGTLETVVNGVTGIIFKKQSVDSLISAIKIFQSKNFSPEIIRKHALYFDEKIFKDNIKEYLKERIKEWNLKNI